MIEPLPSLVPDPIRSAHTRARCHKKLARQVRPREQRSFVIERAVCLGFGAVYLSSLALDVMRLLLR